jgi:hypothetical protein
MADRPIDETSRSAGVAYAGWPDCRSATRNLDAEETLFIV